MIWGTPNFGNTLMGMGVPLFGNLQLLSGTPILRIEKSGQTEVFGHSGSLRSHLVLKLFFYRAWFC